VCGNFELLQRGQTLRAGAPSFQAPAMWLRPFIFDFFFFGRAGAPSFQAPAMWLRPFIFDFFFFGTGIACSAFA